MMKQTLVATVTITLLGSVENVAADDSRAMKNLEARFGALQSKVTALEAEVAALTATLETKQDARDCLHHVGNDLYVDACNLHVRDGTGMSGSAWTVPNGLGNLIVGYNEDHPNGSEKTGSHNVIVGGATTPKRGIVVL